LKNCLDKEDTANYRKTLKQLDKWIVEHLKKNQPAHPFGVVGAIKGYTYDCVATEDE
jgi:hypothetical protein